MAPARDPAFPGVKRTSPINRTCNLYETTDVHDDQGIQTCIVQVSRLLLSIGQSNITQKKALCPQFQLGSLFINALAYWRQTHW